LIKTEKWEIIEHKNITTKVQKKKIDCQFCQEESEFCVILECGHEIHLECLIKMMTKTGTWTKRCPYDRHDINPVLNATLEI
jgi:hypothetical protein